MNFIKKGLVLIKGSSGQIDYYAAKEPSVVWFNNKYYMYYSARYSTAPTLFGTALAISKDGVNFTKKGIILPIGDAGEIDEERAFNPSALFFNNKIYLYYIAYNGSHYRAALAISKNGMNFIKKGVVIDIGSAGEIDSNRIGDISVVYYNNKFYAYYIACDGTVCRIALSISKDGMNFAKKGVVVDLGGAGEIDDDFIYAVNTIKYNDLIYLYYMAYDGSHYRAALAISKNGMNFVKKGVVLDVGSTGEIDDGNIFSPNVLYINNKKYLHYSCDAWDSEDVALAIS